MGLVRKVVRILYMHWSVSLQYRVDMIMWTGAGLLTPLLSLAIWRAVAQSSAGGPQSSQVIAYYVVLIFTATATYSWHAFYMVKEILNGDLVKFIIRPLGYFWHPIINNAAEKMTKIPVLIAAGLLLLYLIPPLPNTIESHIAHPLLFVVSLLLAIVLAFAFETATGLLAFWLEDSAEIIRFGFLFQSVASGILIPYMFMPDILVNIFSFLPFRYIFSAPVEILFGQTSGFSPYTLILIQGAWASLFIFLCNRFWKRGLKIYAVPGQ